ncbi:hypothetical protein ACGF7W_34835 [Streptomyces sp. NPDC048219]|uniref:hypothetical protein n=1 Tax=Streptomyces sp. NPDC048219 TaxID=3365517 RepID=UPI00371CCB9F
MNLGKASVVTAVGHPPVVLGAGAGGEAAWEKVVRAESGIFSKAVDVVRNGELRSWPPESGEREIPPTRGMDSTA